MKPLAHKIRPKTLDDVIGHKKLKQVISKMIDNEKILSMILHGEPGLGKTTIANIIAETIGFGVFSFNASIDNKAKLKSIIDESSLYGCILILDEIHRMNKDIQDYLLPFVESGKITLIGLTTENPFYTVNQAIRSRCHVFKLLKPTKEEVIEYLNKIAEKEEIEVTKELIDTIVNNTNYEIRSSINTLELIKTTNIKTKEELLDVIGDSSVSIGSIDQYYDLLSALHKSIRGSDVDASIYYLAKLIILGDLKSICRRLNAIAYEDIGIADPTMGVKVNAAIQSVERLGLPEARIPLAAIVVDMALSPKSNSAYKALDKAIFDIKNGKDFDSPNNLKNSNTKEAYKYPFEYEYNLVQQDYLPKELNKKYLELKDFPNKEKALKERMQKIDKIIKKK